MASAALVPFGREIVKTSSLTGTPPGEAISIETVRE
jgi:hypothetical protein